MPAQRIWANCAVKHAPVLREPVRMTEREEAVIVARGDGFHHGRASDGLAEARCDLVGGGLCLVFPAHGDGDTEQVDRGAVGMGEMGSIGLNDREHAVPVRCADDSEIVEVFAVGPACDGRVAARSRRIV